MLVHCTYHILQVCGILKKKEFASILNLLVYLHAYVGLIAKNEISYIHI